MRALHLIPSASVWVDLLAEMTEPQWKAYVHRLRNQWRDFQFAHDTERARQILVRLTDENIQRLTAKIEEFDSKLRDKAEQVCNLLSFDHSPRGEMMRRHYSKCRASFAARLRCVGRFGGGVIGVKLKNAPLA